MKLSSLIILLLTGLHGIVCSQSFNFIFKNINRASGLPVDEVTVLAQDSSGFIWIGSREGLLRYDGFNYKSYYHSQGNKLTIPNNYVSRIHVDSKGLLWVGTLGGVALMNDKGKVLGVFNSESTNLFSKESNAVYDIQEDANNIWLSTADGLFQVNKSNPSITHTQKHDLKKSFNFTTNQFGTFVIDREGKLWLSTLHGLAIYDYSQQVLYHKGNNPASLLILNEKSAFKSLTLDEDESRVFYSTWEPAVRSFNISENIITTYYSGKPEGNPEYQNMINQFLKDNHGKMWMATGNGIRTINNNMDTLHISYEPGNIYSLRNNNVTCFLQDKEGSIWAGTAEGISITRPYQHSVVNISVNNASRYPFANEPVNNIIPVSNNTNLITTHSGVYRTDSLFNVKEHYNFGTNKYNWTWNYYKHGNFIYISTQGGNLLYDAKSEKLTKLTQPPFDKFYPIFSFARGKDSSIWMTQYLDNFLHYVPATKNYKVYNLPAMGEAPGIVQLSRDNDNNLWIMSTATGIFKFDEASEKFTERLTVSPGNGLLENHILFFKDLGKEIIIGYVSKGISLYNKASKHFTHLGKSDGLASNSVTDVLQVNTKTVWISTRNGLSKLNLDNYSFENFNYNNGILQNDFLCITALPSGLIAAGTQKGIIYFNQDLLRSGEKLFSPVITGINVHGNELRVDSFSMKHPLHITYNKNYFSIDYISSQYINNEQIEYAYMLEGFNKDWVSAANRRFVSYSNLPGGKYLFRLRARFPGGNWVESAAGLPIVVHAAFYKSVWFYILCAVLITAVMYILFRYRLKQVKRVEKIRSTISSDLHDEVGATLSSISIFSEMAKQSVPADSKAAPFLQRIGDRSRDSIEKMSDIIWSINPENDSFQQMLTRMKTFVNETVEGKDIAVHWHEDEMVARQKLDMAQRKNLYLLFKEAIINVIKYAEANNIWVELSEHNKVISLSIKDDGKGFSFETIKAGNGIKNIRQRAVLLKGTATVTSAPGKGAKVQVEFKP